MELENKVLETNEQQKAPSYLTLTKRDTVFAVGALVVTLFLSLFGLFSSFSLGYLLASTFMIILFAIYFAKGGHLAFSSILCGLLALANGAIFICTTNGSVRFFGVIIGFLLSLVCFDGLVNGASKGNRQTVGIFYSALSTIGNIALSIKPLLAGRKDDKKLIGKVLIGLLCAVPVLIVVVPLLISSDAAFKGMITNIFSNTSSFFLKTIFGVLLCPFVISYGFSLKSGRVAKIKKGKFSGIENTYLISFLSAISVCYLLYLFSQLAYFFSAFKGFLPNGEITYAQYARKGFFEMCIIAVINLVIVFFALLLAKKKKGKVCHSIKAIATFISLFTMIIIATAISKMVLYINAYGMTILRITTSAFMLFLSVVFISVILRIYIKKINIIKTALIAAGCIILILGTVNVNSVCARYNYESYKSGRLNSIDTQELYKLGYEGIPYIIKLTAAEDPYVAKEAQVFLARAYLFDYFDNMETAESFTVADLKLNKKNKGFEYFNIPKAYAYECLYEYIENDPWFSMTCRNFFWETSYNETTY